MSEEFLRDKGKDLSAILLLDIGGSFEDHRSIV